MTLTDDQIKKLADKLVDTSRNVFRVAEQMFGEDTETDDSTFDRLEKVADIFKCEQCDLWMGCCNKKHPSDTLCVTCLEGDDE